MKLNIVIYLVREWESFHRRPMIEAFSDSAKGAAQILCINPTLTPPLRPYLWADFTRKWLGGCGIKQISSNLHIYTPRLFLHSRICAGNIGKKRYRNSLKNQILQVLHELHMAGHPRVAWIFRPSQIDLLGVAEEDHVVYECYDEYQIDSNTEEALTAVRDRELDLLAKVDVVFAVSQSLSEKRSKWHRNVHFIPNGVNFKLFRQAGKAQVPVASELEGIPHPIIGYIGSLDSTVDYNLLEYIADARPGWSLVLVGHVHDRTSLRGLVGRPNVYLLGRKPYGELPSISKGFDVFILACLVNEYLQFSDPLKTWEQLAAGNVIVSADIREVRRLKDIVLIAQNRQEFISLIDFALTNDNRDRIKRGVAKARERTWDKITKKAVDILLEEFAG